MAILGAHMSIAGGYHKAIERAAELGCQCVQIFTKSNNQWRAKDITQQEARRFRQAVEGSRLSHLVAHDSYLINLASPDDRLWRHSVEAFIDELRRADQLGIPYVVTHPGAYTTGTERRGIRRIIRALNEVHRRTRRLKTRCLLETTAGQGTSLGWRFEQLAAIRDGVSQPQLLGFCFDTCHAYAAGYPLATGAEYRSTMGEFDRLIGVENIRVFHLNDSRRELGSRVDRHDHIGRGHMGPEPFRRLLRDRRFRKIPMVLETPKSEAGKNMDPVNLQTLRGLAG